MRGRFLGPNVCLLYGFATSRERRLVMLRLTNLLSNEQAEVITAGATLEQGKVAYKIKEGEDIRIGINVSDDECVEFHYRWKFNVYKLKNKTTND